MMPRIQFDRIACPVGLDISAIGTHEIAVSVIAQLIQKQRAAFGVLEFADFSLVGTRKGAAFVAKKLALK